MKTGFYDLTQFDVDASRLTEVYHARSVRLLGGEPLLNKDLPRYVSIVRATGLADSVGICTNGILLPSVSDELLRGLEAGAVALGLVIMAGGPFVACRCSTATGWATSQ
jgi:hypothetical protein